MDNLLTVAFVAHSDERNHHRRYEVTVGRDLLNHWTLTLRYGRVGHGSQERRYGSPQPETVRALIRKSLLRRLSAPKRIGCRYRLATLNTASGIDPFEWLPPEVMARFYQPA
jgi:predicted DNA-binding WGR domain protein